AVGVRDRIDDREAQARPSARPALVRPAEALERTREEVLRETRPLIANVQLDDSLDETRLDADRPLAVTKRVLDEVAERLLEPQPVAREAQVLRGVDLERPPHLLRPPREAVAHALEEVVRRDALRSERELPLIRAGDQQQIPGQLDEPVGLGAGLAQSFAQLRLALGVVEREVELGAKQRERRPQLVPGLGDEAALALERGLEPSEHLVERLAEPLELVPRARHRQPLSGAVGR